MTNQRSDTGKISQTVSVNICPKCGRIFNGEKCECGGSEKKLKYYRPFREQHLECQANGTSEFQGNLKSLHCKKYNTDCMSGTCRHERIIEEDD